MNTLTTTREVIAALGGATQVARLLGVGRTAVTNWAVTGEFPAKTYLAMKALLRSRGITAPNTLWAMLPPVKEQRRAS